MSRLRHGLAAGILGVVLVAGAPGGGPALTAVAPGVSPVMAAVSAQPPPVVDEFVPIAELPPEDQLPAAPLLVAAYAFAWIAIFGYLFSLWRRLGRVERELADVSKEVASGARRRD